MSVVISSKRYAQAIFEIARENNEIDKWHVYLQKIADLINKEEFYGLLENPKISNKEKVNVAIKLLGDVPKFVINFLSVLIYRNKWATIDQIRKQYELLTDEYLGIKRAVITTAIELDNDSKDKVVKNLENLIAHKIKAEFIINPSIIGGYIAKINGKLIDASIKTRLTELKQRMSLAK